MRSPDEIVGEPNRPHMRRWHLWRGKRLQIVLNQWLTNDARDAHDHARAITSIVLRGRGVEWLDANDAPGEFIYWARPLRPGVVRIRKATDRHRIELATPTLWMLVFTGPAVREWGYWIRGRFVPWRRYHAR